MPAEELTDLDESLIRRASEGDRSVFDTIVERHGPAVFRFARAIARDDVAAEDALQETFLAAWRGASGFRGDATVRSWLLTIARHAIARQRRRRSGEPETMEPLETLGALAGWGAEDDPESAAIRTEARTQILRALESLRTDDREIIILRDLEGLSGDEAASVIGIPVAAMKTRLHRARLRLRAAMRTER